MLTKGLALVLPLPVAAVYLVAWLRHRRPPFAAVGMAAVLSAAIGGWWWIRNLVVFGAVQPNGVGTGRPAPARRDLAGIRAGVPQSLQRPALGRHRLPGQPRPPGLAHRAMA